MCVYELRKKFHYLIKKGKKKNEVQKYLSACVEEQFNGFEIVKKLFENEKKEMFRPLDIVYRAVAKIDQIVNCYFSKSIRNVYKVFLG